MHTNGRRIAIVTGAARGIGAATANRLARDGNAVAVLDMDEAACAQTVSAITSAGGRAIAVAVDIILPKGSRPPWHGSPRSSAPRPTW